MPFLGRLYGIDTLAVMCHAGPTPGLLDIALGLAVPTRATRSGEDLWLGHACHYVDTGCRRDRMRCRVTELSVITCVVPISLDCGFSETPIPTSLGIHVFGVDAQDLIATPHFITPPFYYPASTD